MARAPKKTPTAGKARATQASRSADGKRAAAKADREASTDDEDLQDDPPDEASQPVVAELVSPNDWEKESLESTFDDADLLDEPDPLLEATHALYTPADRPAPLAPRRDPIAQFVAEARRYPRLSEEQERQLIAAVRDSDNKDAARKLVVHNLRLVVTIAYQYRRAWTSMLDLFQEGSIGLIEAVSRWDPSLGTRFGSYAAYWIRAYVLRFLMRNARLIHVGNTRAGRKLFFRLNKEKALLAAAGFDVTPKLLAAKLDVAEKDIEEVSSLLAGREISLAPRPDEEGGDLEERLSAPNATSPEDDAARNLLSRSIRQQMERFAETLTDPREQAVWSLHLASDDDPLSLSVLGERFGVSKQRMGQLADRLKTRFREQIVAAMGADFEMMSRPEANE